MNKIAYYLFLSLFFVSGIFAKSDESKNFFQKHPVLSRASIITLTALEVLLINQHRDMLGVLASNPYDTKKEFIIHNVANAFPTVAKLVGWNVKKYTDLGPMVEATDVPSLLGILLLAIQNNLLLDNLPGEKTKTVPVISESALVTTSGFIMAWLSYLTYKTLL